MPVPQLRLTKRTEVLLTSEKIGLQANAEKIAYMFKQGRILNERSNQE
jgi:hypothetical protein